MTTSIKITALTNIGNDISYTTLVPVVDMTGTPTTEKANLQIIGNLILSQAGGSYFTKAAQAVNSETVSNAAQPAITSVGTLTGLTVSGNINANANLNIVGTVFANDLSVSGTADLGAVSNISISGGNPGDVLTTDGSGNLSWAVGGGGGRDRKSVV